MNIKKYFALFAIVGMLTAPAQSHAEVGTMPIIVCKGTPAIAVCSGVAVIVGSGICFSKTKCRLRIGREIKRSIKKTGKEIERIPKNLAHMFGW